MINLFCVRPRGLNIGNQIINASLRRMLRESFEEPVNLIEVPADGPEQDGWVTGLSARAVHEMNQYGHGVVLGGGNLYENGRLEFDPGALRRLQPPLLLCGLSWGRIYDRRDRLRPRTDSLPDDAIGALHAAASRHLVRDDATLAHLEGLGLDDVRLAGCPAMFAGELAPRLSPRPDSAPVLVAVRNPELMSVPLRHRARVASAVGDIVGLLEERSPAPVCLLCNDRRDMAFAASLDGVPYLLADDLDDYLGLLRRAPLLVSFRLHASVPALALGTPAINLSYDERSLSLVRTLGLGEWDIDFVLEDDPVEAVRDRVDRIVEFDAVALRERGRWDALRATMLGEIEAFAADVGAYAAEEASPEPV